VLVNSAQAGDRSALEALLRLHHDRLYGLCRRMMGNDADAADASQESLVRIVRNLGRFDRKSRFSTWAHRLTVNVCLDELRRRTRRPEPVDDASLDAVTRGFEDTAVARTDIDAALGSLRPEFRSAVVLRDLCGLDYAEIAEVLGIPAGTVRSRIARGRAALADRLGNPETPPARPTGDT
jgi:RNA polymerase sigma-70 factor (ECF subfamily)